MDETAPAPIVGNLDPSLLVCARETSDALRALSHEHRLIILSVLSQGERTVGELEALLNLPQPAVSQQLARLRLDDLVNGRRDGRTIRYELNEKPLLRIFFGLATLLGYQITRVPGSMAGSGSTPSDGDAGGSGDDEGERGGAADHGEARAAV